VQKISKKCVTEIANTVDWNYWAISEWNWCPDFNHSGLLLLLLFLHHKVATTENMRHIKNKTTSLHTI